MTKTLLYITNIPTPYRNFRFNALSKVCLQNGYHLKVLYMNAAEPDRSWTINAADMQHDYQIFSTNKVRKALGMWLHVSPKLQRFLRKADYTVAVLGGLASPAHFIAALLLKPHKLNVLSVESNLSSIGNRSGLATKVKTALMQRFSYFQITGQKAAEFIQHYIPNAKSTTMVTLPNIINETLFDSVQKTDLPAELAAQVTQARTANHTIVLIPARLIEQKGILEFIDIIRPQDAVLILVAGEGPLRPRLETKIAHQQINVSLLGAQPPEVVAALMKTVDFLCLPSKSDPSPLSVIEACACGLPILASRNIGNFEDVIHESNNPAQQNGWGFDFGNPVSTRNGFERLLNASKPEKKAMSKASLKQFETYFRASKVLQSYVNKIKQLEAQ